MSTSFKATTRFKWRIRELWQLVTAYVEPPHSPLWTQYFSNTAYKLGLYNVKFKIQPCQPLVKNIGKQADDPDFLAHTLAQELKEGDACMQLALQLQDVSKQIPIEDATVLWKESDSPFVPVATINILQQTFDKSEQEEFCESLSFPRGTY